MPISSISAITSGSRIKATGRVKMISRGEPEAISFAAETADAEEIVFVRKRARPTSSGAGQQAIAAGGSPASRSSTGVQAELSKLKLGG